MAGLTERLLRALTILDPSVSGNLTLSREDSGRLRIFGRLSLQAGAPEDLLRKALSDLGEDGEAALILVRTDRLTVMGEGEIAPPSMSRPRPWARLLYQGLLSTTQIGATDTYKRENWATRSKIGRCIADLGVIAPLILGPDLSVVDGNLRLGLARELGMEEVPVLVLDVDARRADFLRLVLNRSGEFQRWLHEQADEFVDSEPTLQPLLEPLGFFGERLLPTSYFAQSVASYRLDGSNAQGQYRQEEGLAAWAELQRRRILEQERLQAETLVTRPPVSCFDLPAPGEGDFLPTHEVAEVLGAFVAETKEMAHRVTLASDDRKAR